MKRTLMLTGDVNLMNASHPQVPFGRVKETLRQADVLFGNLDQGKPIFYGLGSFSFHTGHGGRAHGDWVGLLARLTFDDAALAEVACSLVRHDERNHTYVCDPSLDKDAVEQVTRRCDKLGTTLAVRASELIVWTTL